MPDIYRDGKVHVRATPCDRCLFSPDRLVSGRGARAILAEVAATDGASFVCHRDEMHGEPTAICAAWWDRFAPDHWQFRLAVHLGIVERADPNG